MAIGADAAVTARQPSQECRLVFHRRAANRARATRYDERVSKDVHAFSAERPDDGCPFRELYPGILVVQTAEDTV